MENSNYFNLDNRYFRATMKSFCDCTYNQKAYFQFIRTEDGSVYAKIVGSNNILPIYYKTPEKTLKGYIMHEDYSSYYIESPFDIIVSDDGLFTTSKFAPFCQARKDVIDYIELSYKINGRKKTYGSK